MPERHKHLQFQLLDAELIKGTPDQEDVIALIAEKVILGKYDFMAMRIRHNGKKRTMDNIHPDIKMIYDLIKLTNCPVMSLTTRPVTRVFKNILQPVELNINIIERHAQVLHFAKAFHSNIHLLMVCNSIDHEIYEQGMEIMQLSKEYFLRYNVNTNFRIIQHFNRPDTILAYASIIGADLIGNATGQHDVHGEVEADLTWNDLLSRSDIPLYNYIG